MRRLFLCAILCALCASSAELQAQGSPAIANAGGAEGASDVGKYANFGQLLNKQTGGLHFYGKIAMAGDKLPWDPIPVTVTCNGVLKYSTLASPKGEFDIVAAGRESEVVTNKHDVGRSTPSELVGCTVTAVAEGFASSTLTIANRSLEDDPTIGTITLHKDERATGSIVSATTASAPADALKEFEKAHSDELAKHNDGARKHLQKAVSLYPQFAEAWFHLGRLEEAGSPQDALTSYQKAVAQDPAYISPYEHIAALSAMKKQWSETVKATDTALKLDPAGTPQIWYYNAIGNLNMGNRSTAETAAEKSLAVDPNHLAPNNEQLLAVILADRGEFGKALEHLRHCLTYTPPGANADLIKQQIAQLEKLTLNR